MKFIRFILFVVTLFFACGAKAFNIAVVAPKVEKMARFGNELIEGAQIAVDMINENGGLLGDKLNLIAIDDRCEDAFAVSTAQMIALNSSKEDKIDLVVGPFCDNKFEEIANIYEQNKIFRVVPMPLNEKQNSISSKGLIKIGGLMSSQAKVFVDYYQKKLVGKNVAFIYDSSIPKTTETAFETQVLFNSNTFNGLKLFDLASYGEKYDELVDDVLLNAQVVYVLSNADTMAIVIQKIQEENSKTEIFVDAYMATGHIYRELGNFVEGVYFLSYKNIKEEPSFTEKLVELRIKGREPRGLGVYGYAAVNLWAQMVGDAKSVDFDKIEIQKNKNEYEMPWGKTGFKNGSAINSGEYSLYQIKNGEYTQAD